MIYLVLAIMASTAVGHIFKKSEHSSIPIMGILFINYIAAAAISWGSLSSFPGKIGIHEGPAAAAASTASTVASAAAASTAMGHLETAAQGLSIFLDFPLTFYLLAVTLGTLFVICYLLMRAVIERLGIAVTISLSRLSAVIPTLGSLIIYLELPAPLQIPGIILAFIALPLSGRELPSKENLRRLIKEGLGWGTILFIAFGINDFIFKIFTETYPHIDSKYFLSIVFSTALVITAFEVIRRKVAITRSVLLLGLALGVANYLSTYFFIQALAILPGLTAYPLNGMGIIALSTITGVFIWHEWPKPHNRLFLIMAMLATWFLYV